MKTVSAFLVATIVTMGTGAAFAMEKYSGTNRPYSSAAGIQRRDAMMQKQMAQPSETAPVVKKIKKRR